MLAEEFGLPVFPCKPDKRPWTEHGFKDASRNIEQIAGWWDQWPDALIGVPTGAESKLLVIDIDPEGAEWYRAHEAELACGRVHQTRRGHHLLYLMPAREIRCSTGKIAPGVDVRAVGGYVIWWPANGCESVGDLADITEVPAWLLEVLTARANGHDRQDTQGADRKAEGGKLRPGNRNNTLTKMAGSMRKSGFSVEAIAEALHKENYARFEPPLPGVEVEAIVGQVEKWPQGGGAADRAQATAEWQPPAMATYGPGFDPAKIPLRRWLLGKRYAVGEVTVIAGPPGTNKSTLILTDAVQIVTGRKLLQDTVHTKGAVLFLVGEDSRRDIEARLAAILAHYRIDPLELDNKLHVVYLSEVNATDYTLANMIADTAVLNQHMFDWLREFPNVVAVCVDPIIAWHRLIENSTEAMQHLCSSLRALSVQGHRAVIFDHHVTKVAQFDVEAHVGNLPALRGAGSIAADARWAFTMARIKLETGAAHGIPEAERKRYRRLDPLKASYTADDDSERLLYVQTVEIANGEQVGVLVEVDTTATKANAEDRKKEIAKATRRRLAAALTEMLTQEAPRSRRATALWLASRHPGLLVGKAGPLSEDTIRLRLPCLIGAGLDAERNGRHARIVIRESPGRGKSDAIDFELAEARP